MMMEMSFFKFYLTTLLAGCFIYVGSYPVELRIAAFNIKMFGEDKATKSHVMGILAGVSVDIKQCTTTIFFKLSA